MNLLQFISGAFGGLAILDRSLQSCGDHEADNSVGFFILFISLINIFLDFPESSIGKFGLAVFFEFHFMLFDTLWTWMFTVDDFLDLLFGEEHVALE